MERIVYSFAALIFFLSVSNAFSQNTTTGTTQQQDQQQNQQTQQQNPPPANNKRIYEPYVAGEFPEWLEDLRRGEIILFGSFPFSFFFTTEGYDLYRFSIHNFQTQYAPWPLKDPVNGPYSLDEQIGVVIAALSLSFVIAVADYLIRKVFVEKSEKPVLVPDSSAPSQEKPESSTKKDDAPSPTSLVPDQGNQ